MGKNQKLNISDAPGNSNGWDEMACLQGCIKNHLPSQEQLYKHFYPGMMALVKRYTSDADYAGTILNNGFLKVFKYINSFKHKGSLEGWIKKIILHAVADFFKSRKDIHTANDTEAVADRLADDKITNPVTYDYNLLLQTFQYLPPATRLVINLFMIEGFTHREIAKMTGISENTSKWHVAEGKKILIHLFKKQQYEY